MPAPYTRVPCCSLCACLLHAILVLEITDGVPVPAYFRDPGETTDLSGTPAGAAKVHGLLPLTRAFSPFFLLSFLGSAPPDTRRMLRFLSARVCRSFLLVLATRCCARNAVPNWGSTGQGADGRGDEGKPDRRGGARSRPDRPAVQPRAPRRELGPVG